MASSRRLLRWHHVWQDWTELTAASSEVVKAVGPPQLGQTTLPKTFLAGVGLVVLSAAVSASAPLHVRMTLYVARSENSSLVLLDPYSESNLDGPLLWMAEEWLQPLGADFVDVARVPVNVRSKRYVGSDEALVLHIATSSALTPSVGVGFWFRSLWSPSDRSH